jgi:hypothetical protein
MRVDFSFGICFDDWMFNLLIFWVLMAVLSVCWKEEIDLLVGDRVGSGWCYSVHSFVIEVVLSESSSSLLEILDSACFL